MRNVFHEYKSSRFYKYLLHFLFQAALPVLKSTLEEFVGQPNEAWKTVGGIIKDELLKGL